MQVAEGTPPAQGGLPLPVEDYAYDEEGNRTFSSDRPAKALWHRSCGPCYAAIAA